MKRKPESPRKPVEKRGSYQGSFCFTCEEVLTDNLEIVEHEAAEHSVLEYWA